MKPVVGIFASRGAAEASLQPLASAGIGRDRVTLLAPGASDGQIQAVPTTETEQSGMGKAVGGVVGGVFGATTGLGLAEAAASLLIPGVGPVAAVGLAAAALLGAGGVAAGMAAGGKLEETLFRGLPKDEIYLYEDALRQGRSVVIVFAKQGAQDEAARRALDGAGAESLDAARESWWVGLRSAEETEYEGPDFGSVEASYRRGFEAAFRSVGRGDEAETAAWLRREHGAVAEEPAFRRGYERGRVRAGSLREGKSPGSG